MSARDIALTLSCGLLLAVTAGASHITDKLAVGLYESSGDEQPKRVLTSGTPLEIIDRAGRLCKIQLGDGTRGWLECRYVTDEKPARAMLVEAQARAGQLREDIDALKQKLDAERRDKAAVERRLRAVENLLAELSPDGESTPTAMTTPVSSAEQTDPEVAPGDRYANGSAMAWMPLSLGVAAGFTVGSLVIGLRCRRKYGGLRI